MNILYDHQIFEMQKFGGISRYFIELMSRLPSDISFSNSIISSANEYLKNSDNRFEKGIVIPKFFRRGKIVKPLNQLASNKALNSSNFDLFHPTYYNPYFLKKLKKPYVITVYDMIHEKFGDMFSPNDTTYKNKKEVIPQADRIIAISKNTKKDIVSIYGIPEERIDVVHLGHSIELNQSEPVDNLPENYILFVGLRGGYKNFERFLYAFAELKKKFPEIKLVCTGGLFKDEELALLKKLDVGKDVFQYFVTDKQLTYLYQNALCFVYPSLYEGFGIPILEAFAAGCPLALSDTSCFPEIAKDGGAYFDPYEVDSIFNTIDKIISDQNFSKNLVSAGKKVLNEYSWDKMAIETAAIYKKIIK